MNLTFNTYYEQLLYEVGILQKVSVEPGFTSYLDTVKTRAAAAPGPVRAACSRAGSPPWC